MPSKDIINNVMDSSQMSEPSVHVTVPSLKLREKIRDYTKSHRVELRANSLDSLRLGIGDIKARVQELDNLNEKDVSGLAGRIKRRKHATNDDMYRLSYAFLQDEKNIETFSKITGAFQVLIKEFTGKDSDCQLSAAECLCNLSLGPSPVCEKISSMAGSYLVTYLHSTENQLIRICLWTIANILATSVKAASTLMKMQLVPQLWNFYTHDDIADISADFREDAAICLQILALNSETILTHDDREHVLKHITEKNPTCSAGEYHLQIIFHILFPQPKIVASLSCAQRQYLINYSLSYLCNTKEFKTTSQHLKIVYSIRILGNLLICHPKCYSTLLQQITLSWQTNLSTILNVLFAFENPYLTRELFWILKNILHLENLVQTSTCRSNFIETLKIPRNSSNIPSSDKKDVESMVS